MYFWEQISGPNAVITGADTNSPLISGILQTDSLQICEFRLVVSDGEYFSIPDTVELRIIPTHPNSSLVLSNGPFDPNKPTIVFFDGGDCVTSNSYWWFSSSWTSKANAFTCCRYSLKLVIFGEFTFYPAKINL